MIIDDRMRELFWEQAQETVVEQLVLGLGYTAVATSDGGLGVAYTWLDDKRSCQVMNPYRDYEGRPASELLEHLASSHPVHRSMALALVNALNHRNALSLPEDPRNDLLFDHFEVGQGTRVAMVGFFGPLVKALNERGARVEVLDLSREMGDRESFYGKLGGWAEVLFLTSTSILNRSTEEILAHVGKGVRTVLLGPSTPMAREAFEHLPVHMLAGTVPVDREAVLKAVRHGAGTPVIHKHSRKVCLVVDG